MAKFTYDGQEFDVFAVPRLNEDGLPISWLPCATGAISDGTDVFGQPQKHASVGCIPGREFPNEQEANRYAIQFVKLNWDREKAGGKLANGDSVVSVTDFRIGRVTPPQGAISGGHIYVQFTEGTEQVPIPSLLLIPT